MFWITVKFFFPSTLARQLMRRPAIHYLTLVQQCFLRYCQGLLKASQRSRLSDLHFYVIHQLGMTCIRHDFPNQPS